MIFTIKHPLCCLYIVYTHIHTITVAHTHAFYCVEKTCLWQSSVAIHSCSRMQTEIRSNDISLLLHFDSFVNFIVDCDKFSRRVSSMWRRRLCHALIVSIYEEFYIFKWIINQFAYIIVVSFFDYHWYFIDHHNSQTAFMPIRRTIFLFCFCFCFFLYSTSWWVQQHRSKFVYHENMWFWLGQNEFQMTYGDWLRSVFIQAKQHKYLTGSW